MIDWFQWLATECRLEAESVRALNDDGFAVIEGPVPAGQLESLAAAYDRAVGEAAGPDKSVGRTTTRLHDLVNRDAAFDGLYVHPLVLAACCLTIGQSFKLSNLLARSVNAGADSQALHVDVAPGQDGWPMLGFILMLDEFTLENGATRFLPGSHCRVAESADELIDESALVTACGEPGAVVVYNGSIVHGHGTNRTGRSRRSIQGAYIPRGVTGFGLAARMDPGTRDRLSPLAKHLIGV